MLEAADRRPRGGRRSRPWRIHTVAELLGPLRLANAASRRPDFAVDPLAPTEEPWRGTRGMKPDDIDEHVDGTELRQAASVAEAAAGAPKGAAFEHLVVDSTPALIFSARPDGYVDYFNRR